MRQPARLLLAAAATIAMLAIAAPTANAIEVTDEPTGTHCPEVQANNDHTVTGGCLLHASTEPDTTFDLFGHFHVIGEIQLTQCQNEFSARIHESGDGWIYNQVLTEPPVGGPCGLAACDEATPSHANVPWPITLTEFGGAEAIQFSFCLRPTGDPEGSSSGTCTLYIPLVTDAPHAYELRTIAPGPSEPNPAAAPLQSRCSQNAAVSLTGHWTIEGTPIEIAH